MRESLEMFIYKIALRSQIMQETNNNIFSRLIHVLIRIL